MRLLSGMVGCVLGSVVMAAGASDPASSLHLDWRDTTVLPGSDFYTYANGTWQKKNPVPPEYSVWSSFSVLQQKNMERLHNMLISAADDKSAKPGSITQKVGDFYYSGMDEASINKLGLEPLKPEFARINAMKSFADLQPTMTHLQGIGVDVLFDLGSMQDFKDSSKMIGGISQSGLGLPNRDYYLKDDKKFKAIRDAYVQHMAKVFVLLGDTPEQAEKQAKVVMAIETELAKVSMPEVEQRDPHAVYHVMTRQELKALTPDFSWPEYFSAMGLPKLASVNVGMPEFFKAMSKQLRTVPLEDWKAYLRWHLADSFLPYLSQPFVEQNFWMTSQLTGAKKLLPRWKRVLATEEGALGFAIGKLYVETYFSAADKQAVKDMLQSIHQVLSQDLQQLAVDDASYA